VKPGLLMVAAALVLGANVLITVNAARNRSDTVEASLVLTACELAVDERNADNSFTSAHLSFHQPPRTRLNQEILRDLGFDGRGREPARDAFVALDLRDSPPGPLYSRFDVVDAAIDPAALRSRHPDRSRVLILRAVIYVHNGAVTSVKLSRPEIHVPYDLARKLDGASCSGPGRGTHRITVKTGPRYEAWIADVADR
jgi:hypothetical protein